MRQSKGVIEELRAYRGYFVTTSRFTAEAIESSGKSDPVRLVEAGESSSDLFRTEHGELETSGRFGRLVPPRKSGAPVPTLPFIPIKGFPSRP